MPRVCRIINRFNLGGPTYNAAYLTKYLSPDYETLLIGGLKEEDEESSEFILNDLGIDYVIVPEMRRSISLLSDIKAYNRIKSLIKDFKPDIVHTHAAKAGAIGRRAAYKLNVPVILHTYHGHVFHSYFNKYKTSIYKSIERDLAKKSTRIITISDLQKYELTEVYKICSPEKAEVIPLGFDLMRFHTDTEGKRKKFRQEYNVDNEEIAIGIIGRLTAIKNHGLFVEALKYVKENSSKRFRGFIIGDGEEKESIKSAARIAGLTYAEYNSDNILQFNDYSKTKPEITFTSWIKEADYPISGLDIVAMTSLNEGTPVSLIEAQAGNKPIVTTNAGGIENVVIPGETALLSEINDKKSFSEHLLQLVESESLRKQLSKGGWEQVKTKYHYTRLVSDMKRLYDRLLSSK